MPPQYGTSSDTQKRSLEEAKTLNSSLIQLRGMDLPKITEILETAAFFKKALAKNLKFTTPAQGKNIGLLFFEKSTRTRSSFELAAKTLGANTLVLTKEISSSDKGESLRETVRNLEAMPVHAIVLRHSSSGAPHLIHKALKIPVINAGDGAHEHPTQALLDILTLQERWKNLKGKKVLIVGDIAHSRVAHSNIIGLKIFGVEVAVCGPPTLMPAGIDEWGVKVFWDLKEAVKDQDAVMMLRIQTERIGQEQLLSKGEYVKFYSLSKPILALCKKDVLVMAPGPVNLGVELSPGVADGPNSVILDQVANGVPVRMAVLHLLLGGQVFKGGAA